VCGRSVRGQRPSAAKWPLFFTSLFQRLLGQQLRPFSGVDAATLVTRVEWLFRWGCPPPRCASRIIYTRSRLISRIMFTSLTHSHQNHQVHNRPCRPTSWRILLDHIDSVETSSNALIFNRLSTVADIYLIEVNWPQR
jgi:hypothetical protein